MASNASSPFSRARLTTWLTTVQHTSAIAFGTFLFVHLAAPATAVVAPRGKAADLASQTMILGRVYYQNALTEPVVVYASVVVHILAGVAKRALSMYARITAQRERRRAEQTEVKPYRIGDEEENDTKAADASGASSKSWLCDFWRRCTLPSAQTLSGVILAPALAIHVALNRLVPSRSTSPINELSPSEIEYTYVSYGLEQDGQKPASWAYATIAIYTLLLGAGALHVVLGSDRIAQRMRAKRRRAQKQQQGTSSFDITQEAKRSDGGSARSNIRHADIQQRQWRKAWASAGLSIAGASWLAWGLLRMRREGSGLSGYIAKRVHASYSAVWPYSALTT